MYLPSTKHMTGFHAIEFVLAVAWMYPTDHQLTELDEEKLLA